MGPKKRGSNSTGKKKRKAVRTTIELKKEIIAKFQNGVRVSDLATKYNMAKSAMSAFNFIFQIFKGKAAAIKMSSTNG